jgi:hypothetical protein
VRKVKNGTSYFVSVKNGVESFLYMGLMRQYFGRWELILTQKSRVGRESTSFKVFGFIIDRYINDYRPHSEMFILHSGRCSKCGRELTDPVSIMWGMGAVCRNYQ